MASQSFDTYWRGMLQRGHPRRVATGYQREALNISYRGGMPQSRPGVRPYHAGNLLSADTFGMGWFVTSAGRRELLVATSTSITRIRTRGLDASGALSLLSLPSGERTRTAPAHCYFLSLSAGATLTFVYDGVNTNLKYDGTTLTKMGLGAGLSPAAPTTAAIGGFLSDGTRQYVMTLVSAFHEGDPTPEASKTEVVLAGATETQTATFASPSAAAIDDPQVTHWNLYRTVRDGAAYFYVDQALVGNPITDTLADDTLSAGTALEEFVNTAPPGPWVALCEHRGQLIGVHAGDRNTLFHSYFDPDYMVPEGWPANWTTPVAHGDGDKITALWSLNEWVVIFKEHGIWGLQGAWPDTELIPVVAPNGQRLGIGCASQSSVLQVDNRLIFLARDGVYAIDRFASPEGGLQAQRLSGPIDDVIAALDYGESVSLAYDRRHRTLLIFAKAA
jgi:hypothetical protein